MKVKITQEGKIPVSPGSVGLFFEDLNYDLDGGLYAELLENRNFEAKDVHGEWDRYQVDEDGCYAWSPYPAGAKVEMKINSDRPLYAENPHYLRLSAPAGAGVKNKAYDGIYLAAGMKYNVSFYARSYEYKGYITVGVYKKGFALEKRVKIKPDGKWRRFAFRLKAKTEVEKGDFAVTLSGAGTVHLDCLSMIPENAIKGVFRRDLAELMKDMKPGFLRFPGGCVVEGNSLKNRYLWKETLGPRERRRRNWNRWAVHATGPDNNFRSDFSHYGQTLGVGYYEYFQLCEYLGAKPLPVVSVGIACQYMSSEFVPLGDPELEVYIQDALDLIEFANGGADTEWGKVRHALGHPEPFNLEMIGIGNEQWEDSPKQKTTGEPAPNEFYKRFELFEKRIHEKYPKIRIIGTAGPTVETPSYDSAWAWIKGNLEKNPDFVYATDEHFYVAPQWLYDHVHMYDKYPRNCRVYAGEYAAHVPGSGAAFFNAPQANCWEGALAEAAFMTGMEQNADVVVMSSYAPLFGRLGYTQWSPDMIWFNGKKAYPTANYHVQKLYSLYTGNSVLKTEVEGGDKVYATASERGELTFVKIVNAGEEALEAEIEGDFDLGGMTRILRMGAAPGDYNTVDEPEKILPVEVAPVSARSLSLPPRSFSVIVFHRKIEKR